MKAKELRIVIVGHEKKNRRSPTNQSRPKIHAYTYNPAVLNSDPHAHETKQVQDKINDTIKLGKDYFLPCFQIRVVKAPAGGSGIPYATYMQSIHDIELAAVRQHARWCKRAKRSGR